MPVKKYQCPSCNILFSKWKHCYAHLKNFSHGSLDLCAKTMDSKSLTALKEQCKHLINRVVFKMVGVEQKSLQGAVISEIFDSNNGKKFLVRWEDMSEEKLLYRDLEPLLVSLKELGRRRLVKMKMGGKEGVKSVDIALRKLRTKSDTKAERKKEGVATSIDQTDIQCSFRSENSVKRKSNFLEKRP